MSKVLTDPSYYTAIAGKIREKLGVQTQYRPSQMAAAIASIDTSGGGGGGGDSSYEPWTGADTEIDVVITDQTLTPLLGLYVNGTATIDWGDNTTPDTVTGTSSTGTAVFTPHTYAAAGKYKITISGGEIGLFGHTANSDAYGSMLFVGVTDTSSTVNHLYRTCVRAIRGGQNLHNLTNGSCRRLYRLKYASFRYVVNSGNHIFSNCASLDYVAFWRTSVSNGTYVFQYCYSFSGDGADYPDDYNFTYIGGNYFSGCNSLTRYIVPDSVRTIQYSSFSNCYALQYVKFPAGLTNIEGGAFSYCYNTVFDFSACTSIPTIESGVFHNSGTYKIIVPADLYDDWIVATNWTSYASRIEKATA